MFSRCWKTHGVFVSRSSILVEDFMIYMRVFLCVDCSRSILTLAQISFQRIKTTAFSNFQPFRSIEPWPFFLRQVLKCLSEKEERKQSKNQSHSQAPPEPREVSTIRTSRQVTIDPLVVSSFLMSERQSEPNSNSADHIIIKHSL